MRSNALRVGVLGACAAAVLWLPLMAYAGAEAAAHSPLTSASIYYRNELLVIACVMTMLLGAYISAVWNPPQELAALMKRNSPHTNAWCSVGGGTTAFLYVLNQYNALTILHPAWVLGCSFATPLALQVGAPYAIQIGVRIALAWKGAKNDK